MDALFGWIAVVTVIGNAVVLTVLGLIMRFSAKPVEEKYAPGGGGVWGGALSGFEAAFSPTAHEAALERDRQTQRTAPAPSPGDPPWTIDGDRIRIEV